MTDLEIGLEESKVCPSFADLTDLNDPSVYYFKGWDTGYLKPAMNWCYLAEIETPDYHPFRPSAFVKDCRGERHPVIFYLDQGDLLFAQNKLNFQAGHTMALLYAEKKTFMDLSQGVRFEELEFCKVFKCTLSTLVQESKKVNTEACYMCGKQESRLLRCGKCKVSLYCGKDCQTTHWKTHKLLCTDMKILRNLVDLVHSPFKRAVSFNSLSGKITEVA